MLTDHRPGDTTKPNRCDYAIRWQVERFRNLAFPLLVGGKLTLLALIFTVALPFESARCD